MKKFYLVQNDRAIITDLSNKLAESQKYQFAGLSHNKEEIMRNIQTILRCDVVIIADHVPGFTLEELMHYLTSQAVNCPYAKKLVRTIITDGEASRSYLANAKDIGYDIIMSTEWSAKRITSALDSATYQKMCNVLDRRVRELWVEGIAIPQFNEALTEILHDIGIPASLAGYMYLKRAIELAFLNIETVVGGVTKVVYPTIAVMYKTTSARVERSIRHAIEAGWGRAKIETMDKIFSYSYSSEKGKPTNGEFIANIADHLLVRFRRERKEYIETHSEQFADVNSILEYATRKKMQPTEEELFAKFGDMGATVAQ